MNSMIQMELFPVEKAGEHEAINWNWLPRFDNPKNDNEFLLNAQYDYLNGKQEALVRLYELCQKVALRFIVSIGRTNRHVKALCHDDKIEKAFNVGGYMVKRYLEDKTFFIHKNYPGYVYLRVQHELFYQTKAQKLEKYCLHNGLDLFSCTKADCLNMSNSYKKS